MYQNRYISKLPVEPTIKEALIKGSLSHFILEEMLTGKSVLDSFLLVLPTWLETNCMLETVEDPFLASQGEGICLAVLADYADATSDLLLRCAVNYTKEDAIRKKDGGVPADPLAYPPKEFQMEYSALGLQDIKFSVDVVAARLNQSFTDLSLANITAQALFFAKNFKYPERFKVSLGVEYPFMPSPADDYPQLSFVGDRTWNGAIDWIWKTLDNEVVITDHKSSKKCPTEDDILWHSQLNLYVALYYEQTGVYVDYTCINHLPSNSFVMVKPDPGIVSTIYNYYKSLQEDIDSSKFTRRIPTDYQSPCLEYKYGPLGQTLSGTCPYLKHCWENFKVPL